MARAGNEVEELRHRVEEVQDLTEATTTTREIGQLWAWGQTVAPMKVNIIITITITIAKGYLRDEEEEHGLAEVAQDADHGKGHAGKVAEGVAHEDARRVPVVLEQGGGHGDEGDDQVQRKVVGIGCRKIK